jgi:hypothetical protein
MTTEMENDPISFVRGIVGNAIWDILYHEEQLAKAHKRLRLATELVKRGSFDLEAERADVDDEDEEIFENVTQFALSILDECKRSVEYHESGLAKAHTGLAMATIMLERGNYAEIDIEQVRQEQKNKMASHGEG